MAYKNMGTFDLGSIGGGQSKPFAMDAAGIASGQAFLESELEKRDMLVRTPLTPATSRSALAAVGQSLFLL